jgi:hypothetical protein
MKRTRPEILLFVILLATILVFDWFKDWEYDEAWTYLAVRRCGLWDLFTYSKFKFANNHLLNSIYFRVLQWMGVTRPFFFRLLSALGFVLFYSATRRILLRLSINRWYLLFLTLTPYFFYFTLGRGYALAMGAFAFSFYYFLKNIDSPTVRDQYLFVIFGVISCLSIFSFLYPFLAQVAILIWYRRKDLRNVHTVVMGLVILAVIPYVGWLGKIVNDYDPNIIGSNTMVKNGTITSIVTDLTYFGNLGTDHYYKYLRAGVWIILIAPMFYGLWSKDKNPAITRTVRVLVVLVALCLLEMFAGHILARAKYPMGRAVYYIEFIILLMIVLKGQTVKNVALRVLPLAVIFFITLFEVFYSIRDMEKPDIREMLASSGTYPLYMLTSNPNLDVTNITSGINKQNIREYKDVALFLPVFKSDTGLRYLYCPVRYRDSLAELPLEKPLNCRDHMQLYLVRDSLRL